MHIILVEFLIAVNKNRFVFFSKGRGILAHSMKKHSPSGQGVMDQKLESASHIGFTVKKEIIRSRGAQLPFLFIQSGT